MSKPEDNEANEDNHNLGFAVTSSSKELEYGDQLVFASFNFQFGWSLLVIGRWSLR